MNPFASQALAATDATGFGTVINPIITNVVNPVVSLMFAVALIVFAFGVFQMVLNGNDADARAKGKASVIGGLIGMFIMVSAWGIIYLISNTIKTI